VLHYVPNKATKIINACTVLHNMCINREDVPAPDLTDLDEEQLGVLPQLPVAQAVYAPGGRGNAMLAQARIKQATIVRNYFS
jgi:hypothetical protein